MVQFLYKNNPTTDIYFAVPLQDLIQSPFALRSDRPISRIGPNCFLANSNAVVIRYVTDKELRTLHQLKPQKVYYVVDDDFQVLESDSSLPQDYRQRLLAFSQNQLPKLLAITNAIVAPNKTILNSYSNKETLFLHPSFTSVCDDFSHFDEPATIKILFGGTRSHLNDLKMIEDTIARVCKKNPNIQLTTFLAGHAPDSLTNQHNIIHRKATSWQKFQQILKSERYHIALAPHVDTKFNRSRSINKLYDHAAFGAVGIYSDMSPLNQVVESGKTGFLTSNDNDCWETSINKLVQNMDQAGQIAQNGAALARKLGDHSHIRSFWMDKLFTRAFPV